MADNEAKARQKMAEGDKKLKGGGGFFSKMLGGGGGSGDAADLYIQDEEEEEVEEEEEEDICELSTTSSEIDCGYLNCNFVARNVLEFEQHYKQHSFQCMECGSSFDTLNVLNIHQDENHNPFFAIQVERNPTVSYFRCLHPTCEMKFSNGRTRDEHARVIHFIQIESRRRKIDNEKVDQILSASMGKCNIESQLGVDEPFWQVVTPQDGQRKVAKARRKSRSVFIHLEE